ncbi:hypothetical protein [Streptomyces massasporeus]|uniref:hypothetical protein n=1 Tax=Streptomyces massasporeus TaxID=67324 RepID=UPI003330C2E6
MTYTVRWTETRTYERELTDEEFAALKGVSVAELAEFHPDELWDDLENQLGVDDGFAGPLEREIEDVTQH